MSKKKDKEEVIGSVKLVCNRGRWTSFKDSCDRILSVQNCANFFGPWQPCDCFEMQEIDIRDRELERIEQMIVETQNQEAPEELEVKISQEEEPPLPDTPRKKRRRRRKRSEIDNQLY
jgi:hypothetical protein